MKRPADRPREGWRQRPSTSVAVSSSGAPSSRSGPPAPLRVRTRDAERTVALPPKADRRWRYGDFSLAGYISARRTPARTRHRHSVRPSRRNSHRRSRSPRRRRRFRGRQHRPADRRLDRHRAARHHRGHCHQHLPGRPPRPSARPEHWALGTGHRAPGTGHRAPGTGHRAPGIMLGTAALAARFIFVDTANCPVDPSLPDPDPTRPGSLEPSRARSRPATATRHPATAAATRHVSTSVSLDLGSPLHKWSLECWGPSAASPRHDETKSRPPIFL